jgi:CRP-like cAMP-binding protein
MNGKLTIEQRRLALKVCPVFANLPGDELSLLAEVMQVEHLLAGETLFEAGDPSDRIFVVVSGQLGVRLPGRSDAVRTLDRGDLLGEYGLVLNDARTASVLAESESLLLSLDNERFRTFLLRFPAASLLLLRTAAQRLVEAERRAKEN